MTYCNFASLVAIFLSSGVEQICQKNGNSGDKSFCQLAISSTISPTRQKCPISWFNICGSYWNNIQSNISDEFQ